LELALDLRKIEKRKPLFVEFLALHLRLHLFALAKRCEKHRSCDTTAAVANINLGNKGEIIIKNSIELMKYSVI